MPMTPHSARGAAGRVVTGGAVVLAAVVVLAELMEFSDPAHGPLLPFIIALAALGTCVGSGLLIVHAVLPRTPRTPWLERLPHALAVGAVAQGWLLAIVAAVGALRAPVLAVVELLGCTALVVAWRRVGGTRARPAGLDVVVGAARGGLAGAVIAVLVLMGAAVLVPSSYYDALVYHLAVPSLYLEAGGFVHVPGNIYACFPFLVDLLNTLCLAWDPTGVAAGIFNASFTGFAVIAVADAARRLVGARAAGWATLLFASSPLVGLLTCVVSNDMPMAFFGAVAMNALVRHARAPGGPWLWLGAVAAGGAFFTKSVGALCVGLPFAVTCLALERRRPGRVVAAGMLALAVNVPVWVKNAVLVGNPIMPALWSVLGGRDWSEVEAATFRAEMRAANIGPDLVWEMPLRWLRLFVDPPEHLSRDWMGFLVAAAVLAMPAARGPRVRPLAGITLLMAVAWTVSFQTERFLPPLMLPLCILQGAALARVVRMRPAWWPPLVAVAWLGVVGNTAWFLRGVDIWQPGWTSVLAGAIERRTFIEAQADYVDAEPAARAVLSPGQRILMLGEGRTFFMSLPVVPTSAMNMSPLLKMMRAGMDDAAIMAGLSDMKVGAVLFRPNEIARLSASYASWAWTTAERERLGALLAQRMRLVFRSEDGRTLLFQPVPPPPS